MFRTIFLTLFAVLCFALGAAEESLKWNIQKYRNEGESNGAIALSKTENALKITLSRTEKFYGGVYFEAPQNPLNLEKYNTLQIRLHPENEAAEEILEKTVCAVYSTDGGWGSRGLEIQKQQDGTYLASWDIINKPPAGNYGFEPARFFRIRLSFPYAQIPEGEKLNLELLSIKSVTGMSVSTGDPALFAKWKETIKNYRPDLNMDMCSLNPPAKGRLAAPFALVKDGQAVGEIVIPAKASEAEKYAAKELQLWISEITGGKLPIVTASTGKAAIELKTLPGDNIHGAWEISGSNNKVTISGIGNRGVIAGAAAFLENNSDIIWARPNREFGTVYTQKTDFNVVWGKSKYSPKGLYRGWLNNWGGGAYWILPWLLRNGGNYRGTLFYPAQEIPLGMRNEYGGGHNLQSFVPKDDPAFYPVIKGKKVEKLNIWKCQICMSAPNLVKVYAENVRKDFDRKAPAGTDVVNIKIEDNWGVCECAKCTAPIRLPYGKVIKKDHPAFRSTQFFIFLNGVAKELRKNRPDLQIQTYGYFFTSIAPLCKVEPNIWILWCPYPRIDHKTPLCSPVNDNFWQRFVGWQKATPNIIVREYYGILNDGRPLAEVAKFDLQTYFAKGVRSMAPELNTDGKVCYGPGDAIRGSDSNWDLDMLEFWVLTRLYMNPDQDVAKLRKYFIERTFHGGAPAMAKYYEILRATHYQMPGVSGWGAFRNTVNYSKKETELRKYLDEALANANNPLSAHLIARIRVEFDRKMKEQQKNSKASLQDVLYYGWGVAVRENEVYGTTRWNGEKLQDIVRFVMRKSSTGEIRLTLPKDIAGKTLSFRLERGKNFGKKMPHSAVFYGDKWTKDAVPESAWKKNEDGSYDFIWKISDSMTFEKISSFRFQFPVKDIQDGEEAEFIFSNVMLK